MSVPIEGEPEVCQVGALQKSKFGIGLPKKVIADGNKVPCSTPFVEVEGPVFNGETG
jgi:hypothetical protein